MPPHCGLGVLGVESKGQGAACGRPLARSVGGVIMSRIELNITRTAGVNGGGYRIAAIVGGAYVSRLFLGYTRREAVRLFRAAVRAGGVA